MASGWPPRCLEREEIEAIENALFVTPGPSHAKMLALAEQLLNEVKRLRGIAPEEEYIKRLERIERALDTKDRVECGHALLAYRGVTPRNEYEERFQALRKRWFAELYER